jgi:hypothetical protein
MRINKQKNKYQLVTDGDKLRQMAICLAESPVLANRKLAFELRQAMDDLNKREGK